MLCVFNMQKNLNAVINKLIFTVESKCPEDTMEVGTGNEHWFACCLYLSSTFYLGERSMYLVECSFVIGDGLSSLLKTAIWSRSLMKALGLGVHGELQPLRKRRN